MFVKRSTEKQCFLMNCLTTIAVHFEVIPPIDITSCVMGIEGSTTIGALHLSCSLTMEQITLPVKKLLPKASAWNWNQEALSETLVIKLIQWKIILLSSPHHGVWERIARSFKHAFYAILGNRSLNDEIRATTFRSVDQSSNSRPLVHVSSDDTALDALTPNHFLFGFAGSTMPSDLRAVIYCRKRYVRAEAFSDALWEHTRRRSKWSAQPD